MVGLWLLSVLTCGLMVLEEGNCWTYHHSKTNMTFLHAKDWCKKHFTDMVAIQNKEEIAYLNASLPFNPTYYWIGIRKIGNKWTWIGTNKQLTAEAENWAKDEPNNGNNNEDCVEIYIKQKNSTNAGKWNDESCSKEKVALCYTASCNASSCSGSGRGECVETINNHTCLCYAGFHGPECQHVVACDRLKEPEHGTLECVHPLQSFSYNSSCKVQCAEGYAPTEEPVLCTSSGSWSAPTPACTVVQCDGLRAPAHGSLTYSPASGNFVWNSTCDFACEEGFALKGSGRLQCGASGRWEGQPPTCEAVTCEAVRGLENGFVECTPHEPAFTYNSTCDFRCLEGYWLRGAPSVQCTEQGEWSMPFPKCEVVQCDGLRAPAHGSLTCSPASGNSVWNSTCDFACEEGFALKGSGRLECGASGRWEGQPPTCEAVTCEAVRGLENGFVDCTPHEPAFTYSSTCEFYCEEGYRLRGEHTVQCTAQGEWSTPFPKCEVVQCDGLRAPAHGSLTCSPASGNFVWNSTCDFACEEGFALKGSGRLQCDASGRWEGQPPTCEAVTCEAVRGLENGFVDCTLHEPAFTYNSTCEFYCEEGYWLRGERTVQCTAQGEWSTPFPKCEVVQCDSLRAPAHGSLTCSPASGNSVWNSTCDFACEEGFALKGSGRFLCDSSGRWEGQPPTCEAVTCEAVRGLENGFVECTPHEPAFTFSSTCEFRCEEGYQLRGPSSVQCTGQGEWSTPFPKCEVVQCDGLRAPAHGSLTCSPASGNSVWNSTCDFACEEGFALKGSGRLQCGASGRWEGQPPTCEAVTCEVVRGLENGFVECTPHEPAFTYSSSCEFRCEEGYRLRGERTVQCTAQGEWSTPFPKCEVVQCETLMPPEKGSMNCSHPLGDFASGTVCKFNCTGGWLLNGSNVLQCGPAGNWTSRQPTCEAPPASKKLISSISIAIAATSASLLSTASFLIWLVKRLRRKAKKFTPASSCQTLNSEGTYQSTG